MTSQVRCTWHGVVLDGGDDSDIQGGILAPCPVADQDICRSAIIARKEKSPLLDRAQACSHSRVEKSVPKVIVAAVSFTTRSAAHGVVTIYITLVQTCWSAGQGPAES